MAMYMSLMQGGTVIGGPVVGWMGTRYGPSWSILVGSIPSVLVALAVGAYLVRRARVTVRCSLRTSPHLRVVPIARDERPAARVARRSF